MYIVVMYSKACESDARLPGLATFHEVADGR
jgi:hypothetical protein